MNRTADELMAALLKDAASFRASGGEAALLEALLRGESIEILRELMHQSSEDVRRTAAWIGSELGCGARGLVPDAIELLANSSDGHVKAYCLEIIAMGADGEQAPAFVHLLRVLEVVDDPLRIHAMWLASNASREQLVAARGSIPTRWPSRAEHVSGLAVAIDASPEGSEISVETSYRTHDLLTASSRLLRAYGAIAARRQLSQNPMVLQDAMRNSDPDVSAFAKHVAFVLDG